MGTKVALSRLLAGFGVVAVGFIGAAIEIERSGRAAMVESDRAFDRGEMIEAITYAHQARRSYVPWLPHLELAQGRLRAIALGAEATNRPNVAILAWSAVRSAEHETRWFSVEDSPAYREANRHLVRLMLATGATESGESVAEGEDRASRAWRAYLEQSLEHRLLPHPLRRALVVACTFMLFGSVVLGAPGWFAARSVLMAPRYLVTAGCGLIGLVGLCLLLGGG